jgi:hypothetical protein
MIKIVKYSRAQKSTWDDFIRKSKNGTFLFLRDYMDYHSDRFMDHSLLFMENGDKLIAVLPANIYGNCLYSHQGLTFGGLVSNEHMKAGVMTQLFADLSDFLLQQSLDKIVYKAIPYIYHRVPAQEDIYALMMAGGRIIKNSLLFCAKKNNLLPYRKTRLNVVKKGQSLGVVVHETDDLKGFWSILAELLEEKYNSHPVHTLDEIERLYKNFPENIKLIGSFNQAEMIAGVLIYQNDQVCRIQYVAATEKGRNLGGVDCIVDYLLRRFDFSGEWFDFGTSEIKDGLALNKGLIEQKEGFGFRTILQSTYELDLKTADVSRLRSLFR